MKFLPFRSEQTRLFPEPATRRRDHANVRSPAGAARSSVACQAAALPPPPARCSPHQRSVGSSRSSRQAPQRIVRLSQRRFLLTSEGERRNTVGQFPANIRCARLKTGFSQQHLAFRCGLHRAGDLAPRARRARAETVDDRPPRGRPQRHRIGALRADRVAGCAAKQGTSVRRRQSERRDLRQPRASGKASKRRRVRRCRGGDRRSPFPASFLAQASGSAVVALGLRLVTATHRVPPTCTPRRRTSSGRGRSSRRAIVAVTSDDRRAASGVCAGYSGASPPTSARHGRCSSPVSGVPRQAARRQALPGREEQCGRQGQPR